jgi:hypothetical protein
MDNVSIVALYRGTTLADAKLVGVSVNPSLVISVTDALLAEEHRPPDSALSARHRGTARCLRAIRTEADRRGAKGGAA